MDTDDQQIISQLTEEFNASVEQDHIGALKTSAVWAHQELAQVTNML